MKVPLFSLEHVPATLYESASTRVKLTPVEFDWNENWFTQDEIQALVVGEGWSMDEVNTLCGLVKRLLAEFGKLGLSRNYIDYHQAQSMAVKMYRKIKARAEEAKLASARKAAARAESDRMWGNSMSGQVNARGGIIAPFNNKLYRNQQQLMADAQALGYIHVGTENLEKAVMQRRRQNQAVEKPRIQRARRDALDKVLHQQGFSDSKLRNVRLRMH